MEVYGKMAAQFDTGITVKNKKIVTDTVTVVKSELEIAEHEAAVALSAVTDATAAAERATAKVNQLKADMLRAEVDEDEEIERLFAEIKANRAKKAQREATADIQKHRDRAKAEIQQLIDRDEKLILEIKERITANKEEQNNIDKGVKDTVLTSHIVRQAEQIQLTPITLVRAERPQRAEGEKRVRNVVPRPALAGLIKSRTLFRYKFKGVVFCDTASTDTYDTLAEFCDKKIKASGEAGGTTVSVYEKVEVKLNHCPSGDPWRKWGDIYHISTTQIN